MPPYEFSLIVDGIPVDDPEHEMLLSAAGADDALLFEQGGITFLAFHREAGSGLAAVGSAIDAVHSAYPSAEVAAIDFDLVAISEIARRLGLSREAVRLYAEGKRRSQNTPFPRHIGVVGKGQRVWPWAVVYEWASSAGVEVTLDEAAQPVPFREVLPLQAWLASAERQVQRRLSAEAPGESAEEADDSVPRGRQGTVQGGRSDWQEVGRFVVGGSGLQGCSTVESESAALGDQRDARERDSDPTGRLAEHHQGLNE